MDDVLQPITKNLHYKETFRKLFHIFYEFGKGHLPTLSEDKMRKIHVNFKITNKQFDRIKSIFADELIEMNIPFEFIMICIWRMETFRAPITN